MECTAFVSLGSNLGDRDLNLLRAVAAIGKISGTRITALSAFYDTDPVGVTDQPPFLNAAARVATTLPPQRLLECLLDIETEIFGRKRGLRWGPRTMDLDLLLYEDAILAEEDITVPHPRLHERRFVLAPLAEIAAEVVHPQLKKNIAALLDALPEGDRVVRV